jgi:ParB family chromosome partitioning protein
LAVTDIQPNAQQPRQGFHQDRLDELAASIRQEGVMQPIVVRKSPKAGGAVYELIAGERRWRAAQIAGLDYVPALLQDLDDGKAAEWALIENLQREDLNPMERAEAFQHLLSTYNLNHDEVAERVGLDRSTVTNHLRLLVLAPQVRQLVAEGHLQMGHARALAGVTDHALQEQIASRVTNEQWSVRKVEAEVRRVTQGEPSRTAKPTTGRSSHLVDLEQKMTEQLGTKVKVKPARKKGTGSLTIDFYSLDHFDELLQKLGVSTD